MFLCFIASFSFDVVGPEFESLVLLLYILYIGRRENVAKISFNKDNRIDNFTIILVRKDYYKIGALQVSNVIFNSVFNGPDELSFKVHKKLNDSDEYIWDRINDHNAIYVPEIDAHGEYFAIETTLNEDADGVYKTVTCTGLAEEELDNTKVYNLQINNDDERQYDKFWGEDFVTVLYRDLSPYEAKVDQFSGYKDYPENSEEYKLYHDAVKTLEAAKWYSLLHRVLDKAPNYHIKHVDSTLVQLTEWYQFTLDDVGIYSALTGDIAEQYHCYFKFDSYDRSISVYDLYSTCMNDDCDYRAMMKNDRKITTRYRGDFRNKCPYCDSTNVINGYGIYTKILVSKDNLLKAAQVASNKDQLKNCFHVEGGDEDMTAAMMNQNPNGSNYIYQFSEDTKEEMPPELVEKIEAYDEEYNKWYVGDEDSGKGIYTFNADLRAGYDDAYHYIEGNFDEKRIGDFSILEEEYKGYNRLSTLFYNTLDMQAFLQLEMCPDVETDDASLTETMARITKESLEPVAVMNKETTSNAIVESAIEKVVKILVNVGVYSVEVKTDSWTPGNDKTNVNGSWTGDIVLKTIEYQGSEEEKKYTQKKTLTLEITDDYTKYIEQSVNKMIAKKDERIRPLTDTSDFGKMAQDGVDTQFDAFKERLKYYSFDYLKNIVTPAFDAVLGQLVDYGSKKLNSLFRSAYNTRLSAVAEELEKRQKQIDAVTAVLKMINGYREKTQRALNFSSYLGDDLWKVFCNYRREDTYKNDNYISASLNNSQLIIRAHDLLDEAQKELYKASHLQYNVQGTLNNLLALPEFAPIVDEFEVGNFIHMKVNDKLYELRLLSYQIDFSTEQSIDVEFSTVESIWSGASDVKSVLEAAGSIAGSYSALKEQVKNYQTSDQRVKSWYNDGIDATTTLLMNNKDTQDVLIDTTGIWARAYDDITEDYSDNQLRIISNGLYTTTDNWEHVKTGIGEFVFVDPETGQSSVEYGVIADTVVGKLIVGENLKIYSSNANMKMDDNGLTIKNADGNVVVSLNPTADNIFTISKNNSPQFYVDSNGNVTLNNGTVVAGKLQSSDYKYLSGHYATKGMQIDLDNDTIRTPNFAVDGSNVYLNNGKLTAGVLESIGYSYTSGNTYATSGMQIDLTNKTIRTPNFAVDGSNVYLNNGTIVAGVLQTSNYQKNPDEELSPDSGDEDDRWQRVIPYTKSGMQIDLNNNNIRAENFAVVNGVLYSDKAKIGPWFLEGDSEKGAIWSYSSDWGTQGGKYFGTDGISISNTFKVNSNGVLNATGATISGALTATSGGIGGFTIDSTSIHTANVAVTSNATNSVALSSSTFTRTIGTTSRNGLKFAIGSNFGVASDGTLYADDVSLSGYISASSGYVGGWLFDSDGLYKRSTPSRMTPTTAIFSSSTSGISETTITTAHLRTIVRSVVLHTTSSESIVKVSNDSYESCLWAGSNGGFVGARYKDQGFHIQSAGTVITLGGTGNDWLRPDEDNSTQLGHKDYRWTTVYAVNGTINTSDAKEKDVLGSIDYAHDLIMSLSPKAYMWKNGDHRRTRMGFLAQDVADTCNSLNKNLALVTASYIGDPSLGEEDPMLHTDYFGEKVDDNKLRWGLSYHELVAPMVQVIQDQDKEIKQLRQELDDIKATLNFNG